MTLIGGDTKSEPLSERIVKAMERHAELSAANRAAQRAAMADGSRAYRAGEPTVQGTRGDKERLARQAATELGLVLNSYRRGGTVVRWVFDHPDEADVLSVLDNEGIEPAFRVIETRERRWAQKRSVTAAAVNAAIPQAVASLEGIVMGLGGLPLDLADDPDRERWAAALRRSAKELIRFAKEVTNAPSPTNPD